MPGLALVLWAALCEPERLPMLQGRQPRAVQAAACPSTDRVCVSNAVRVTVSESRPAGGARGAAPAAGLQEVAPSFSSVNSTPLGTVCGTDTLG
ncbi:hypothetical protein MC885_015883 [Smutsia gigantea]|nr:hypothetical protein MC885_015883 [Smutsia gigantea]